VNVGTDHDTGAFAVASIRGWWRTEGRRIYPDAKSRAKAKSTPSSKKRRKILSSRPWRLGGRKILEVVLLNISDGRIYGSSGGN